MAGVAISVIGTPLTSSMTKYGRPAVGGAGVEDLGDVRVVHHRQRLPLGLEPGDDLLRVHARLDDLQRDPAADGLLLLGQEDDAHAPLADPLEELVGPDVRARPLEKARPGGAAGGRAQSSVPVSRAAANSVAGRRPPRAARDPSREVGTSSAPVSVPAASPRSGVPSRKLPASSRARSSVSTLRREVCDRPPQAHIK